MLKYVSCKNFLNDALMLACLCEKVLRMLFLNLHCFKSLLIFDKYACIRVYLNEEHNSLKVDFFFLKRDM